MSKTDIYDHIDTFLSMDDPDFGKKLMEAIGAKPGEKVEFMTPQFKRTDGLQVPLPLFDFNKLHTLSEATLKAIGCGKWDDPDKDGNVLWLYPCEWYDHIPEGHEMTCISGEKERFKKGETDDDMRHGMLAYGFMRKAD